MKGFKLILVGLLTTGLMAQGEVILTPAADLEAEMAEEGLSLEDLRAFDEFIAKMGSEGGEFEATYIVPGRPRPPRYPGPPRRPNPPPRPPRRPYPPPRRPQPIYDYICWAESDWGDTYHEYGFFPSTTQCRAMDECYRYNRVCYPLGCDRL